jgi:phenylpropionate dioxygenase-like ring-hydroxylating dioxygenase large terminal subunit
MTLLLDDAEVARRVLDHIDHETTDLGDECWSEPVDNYRSQARLDAEIEQAFRRTPTPFCPSVALPNVGSYVAREAAGTPLLAVRGADGVARVFRNACRHRGVQLACGQGRSKAFTCPYHGWTYALDGALRGVPHEYGFPGLDKETHGLVPVKTEERAGMIFVTQAPGASVLPLETPEKVLGPELELVSVTETVNHANWKTVAEGFLEGYHIFSTHRDTFYPVQFDNLNVVERFGRNSRVTFPYRNINKLRDVAPAERRVGGTLTYVYHFFPNVVVVTFPKRTIMLVMEPHGLEATKSVVYTMAPATVVKSDREGLEGDTDFVNQGLKEDRAVIEAIQRGLASEANDHFTFGLCEAAIVHFHRTLHATLGE